MYCVGEGSPTIVLESGFGGGTAATWMQLQPRLGALTRTCSYDRAGYGFSTLGANLPRDLQRRLEPIRRCLARAGAGLVASIGDECVNPEWYSALPTDLASVEIANRAKPDYWRAYLSEAEQNYTSIISSQARALLPHKWTRVPVRVFVASVSETDDVSAARAFGLDVRDKPALAEARAGRARGEKRQQSLCAVVRDCRAFKIPTANHLVHNEALPQVVEVLTELVVNARRR